jgi:hypothetical protein
MKYTVLLLRPDYMASQSDDTYLAHVEAETVEDAAVRAQIEAHESDNVDNGDGEEVTGSSLDYAVLFITTGHLDDLSAGL